MKENHENFNFFYLQSAMKQDLFCPLGQRHFPPQITLCCIKHDITE